MNVTLAMVSSLDGRITNGRSLGTAEWASPEDQQFFKDLVASHDCVVMGSETYAAAREHMRPNPDKPRFILTHHPERFGADNQTPGLEFMAAEPKEVIARAAAMACHNMLLAGGADINSQFLDAGLVNEAYVTIEPLLFGVGLPLTQALSNAVHLRLLEQRQLNDRGTLLLHYIINHPGEAA